MFCLIGHLLTRSTKIIHPSGLPELKIDTLISYLPVVLSPVVFYEKRNSSPSIQFWVFIRALLNPLDRSIAIAWSKSQCKCCKQTNLKYNTAVWAKRLSSSLLHYTYTVWKNQCAKVQAEKLGTMDAHYHDLTYSLFLQHHKHPHKILFQHRHLLWNILIFSIAVILQQYICGTKNAYIVSVESEKKCQL